MPRAKRVRGGLLTGKGRPLHRLTRTLNVTLLTADAETLARWGKDRHLRGLGRAIRDVAAEKAAALREQSRAPKPRKKSK